MQPSFVRAPLCFHQNVRLIFVLAQDWRFYAANVAATGLLVSAVRFPLPSGGATDAVSGAKLASVVMLTNRLPGAGLVGLASATLAWLWGRRPTVGQGKDTVVKSAILGISGCLCAALFLDKRGLIR